jgi:hypothetical protein
MQARYQATLQPDDPSEGRRSPTRLGEASHYFSPAVSFSLGRVLSSLRFLGVTFRARFLRRDIYFSEDFETSASKASARASAFDNCFSDISRSSTLIAPCGDISTPMLCALNPLLEAMLNHA